MDNQNKQILSQTEEIVIGKNKYIVTTHYKADGRETAEQKLLRYVIERISAEIKGNNASIRV
ncbi:hypothetical protein FACS189499_05760 [Clostridia bacterium]|nr:hypothetical protein FACS189499_05760 [Clostridia bacterium]